MSATLFDRRLLIVSGKGGVGRTTLTGALGLAAAASGKRTAVVELSGLGHLARAFGLNERSYTPRQVAPGLDTFSLSAPECMEDFGRRKLGLSALSGLLFNSRATGAFLDAVPGLHDLVQLGKIENLINEPLRGDPRYDLIIVDAPATGHGLTLLAAARAMREITRVGPFFELARIIESLLSNPAEAGLVLATLPEELPVHESLDFIDALSDERGMLCALLANQVRPRTLPESLHWQQLDAALAPACAQNPSLAALWPLTARAAARSEAQRDLLDGLAASLDAKLGGPIPLLRLPRVHSPPLDPAGPLVQAIRDQLGSGGQP